jgi:uncharacterized repeat protein (TIGR03806 family)
MRAAWLWSLALAWGLVGCGGQEESQGEPASAGPVLEGDIPFERLSEYGFFEGALAEQRPARGVIPYRVAAPLWADHAEKGRFFVLPEGAQVQATENEGWTWPQGAILIKTFYFSVDRRAPEGEARIIETRLLRLEEGGWRSYIYIWDDAQQEASLHQIGRRLQLAHTDAQGQPATQTYLVPNREECAKCHKLDDVLGPLGLTTPQMNVELEVEGKRVNQLEWLVERGALSPLPADAGSLDALPDPFDEEAGSLDARARAYLHGNCAHCHREGGNGGRSGLSLLWWEDRPNRMGICKSPVAAGDGSGGRRADIVPGSPDESILIYRVESTDPEIKMPELPNLTPDDQGAELLRAWIESLSPQGCP